MLRIRFQNEMHVLVYKTFGTLQQLKTSVRTIFTKIPKQFDFYYQIDKHLLKVQNGQNGKLNNQQITDLIQNKIRLDVIEVPQNDSIIRNSIEFDQDLIKSLQASISFKQQNQLKLEQSKYQHLYDSSILLAEQIQIQVEDDKKQIFDQDILRKRNLNQDNKSNQKLLNKEILPMHQAQNKLHYEDIKHSVQCDNCFCFPIKNTRYKCSICKDYDLCAQCQNQIFHSHPLLKINTPLQIVKISIYFDEQQNSIMEEKQKLYDLIIKNQKELQKQKIRGNLNKKVYVPESQRKQVNIEGNNFLGCALGMKTHRRQFQQINMYRNMQKNSNYNMPYCQGNYY